MLIFKNLSKFGIAVIACALLVGCGKNQDSTNQDVNLVKGYNVFGENNKELVDPSATAFQLIGKLITPNGTYCTASLVGKDLILTAAHCVLENNELMKGDYQFFLGLSEGKSLAKSGVSKIWWGTSDPVTYRNKDWAIVRLNKSLGEKYGFFGLKSSSAESLENVMQAGYGKLFYDGKSMTGVEQCSAKKIIVNDGIVLHDCDSSQGDSGSPLFYCDEESQCFISALHVSEFRYGNATLNLTEYSDKNANVAIFTQTFLSKILELRAANP